jgi:hypothetical protein
LFIFERPSMPRRFASLYSCSFVLPPFPLERPAVVRFELDRVDDERAEARLVDERPEDERPDEERPEDERLDEDERDELERDDEPDFDFPFVSPDCARCLFTVRAAISFARFVERPCFFSLSLTCSYCRSRLLLHDF